MLAAAAQQLHLTITRTEHSIVGVRLPDVTVRKGNLALRYTLSDSSASVDDCARAAALALEHLIDYAREESAVRRLRAALARTARRLNALDLLVIPQLEHELHDVVAAIEEEERDERLRTKRWIASQSECAP
jgi:V/A-type H+-transporting ATPase subunit D